MSYPWGPDVERTINGCAWVVSRGCNHLITHEDLKQEARLALLVSIRRGSLPEDPLHRHAYIITRVYGAMLDANRKIWRHAPYDSVEPLGDNTPEQLAPGRPDTDYQLHQALSRLDRDHKRLAECLGLLIEGHDCQDVARMMNVSPSRISQFKRKARKLVALYL